MPSVSRRVFLASTSAAAAQTASDVIGVKAPPVQHLLSGSWPESKLHSVLLPAADWHPFPKYGDRSAWESVSPDVRGAAMAAADKQFGASWPSLTATLFLEFVRDGNRSRYEAVSFGRRDRVREAVVAECLEAKGRLLDDIANGLWLMCEETYWGVPAHVGIQKRGSGLPDVQEPTIDLFAAETGELLAWTSYLLGPALDKVHPLVRERINVEIGRRLLTPYRERNDFWWMGLDADRPVNNWNPWINSNILACALLVEGDPVRRAALVHKVLTSLDRFLDSYHPDGGCDEGPGYWGRAGGSLFDNLELLHSASGGAIDFYRVPLIGEIGRYIYRAHIHDRWFINFADAAAKEDFPGELVYRYGVRIGDEPMQAFGAWGAQSAGVKATLDTGSIGRELAALFDTKVRTAAASQPLVRDMYLPGIQIMAARLKQGSADGLYLAGQGGHNAESHNHNDVGNFIVYANGEPAIIDVGVETYTAKTFSSQRYDIWTMQSAYHNLPTVNGIMQGAGRQFEAREVEYHSDEAAAQFRLDIAAAYPVEAGIERWIRTLRLDRQHNVIEVSDAWTLRGKGSVAFTLMTPVSVSAKTGLLELGRILQVRYDPATLASSIEPIPIADARLKASWGSMVYRILLKGDVPASGESLLRILPFRNKIG
jgi:hypothetical protein